MSKVRQTNAPPHWHTHLDFIGSERRVRGGSTCLCRGALERKGYPSYVYRGAQAGERRPVSSPITHQVARVQPGTTVRSAYVAFPDVNFLGRLWWALTRSGAHWRQLWGDDDGERGGADFGCGIDDVRFAIKNVKKRTMSAEGAATYCIRTSGQEGAAESRR